MESSLLNLQRLQSSGKAFLTFTPLPVIDFRALVHLTRNEGGRVLERRVVEGRRPHPLFALAL